MSLTTYRRSGDAVPTPVWVVGLDDGRVGFWTSSGTGKTKRIAHTSRVEVRPCDRRGRVADGVPTYAGTADMVRSGRAFAEVQAKVREKYGFMTKLTPILAKLGRQKGEYADTVVLLTLTR